MRENETQKGFTIYLEGHEGHQGNVLLHSFLTKVQKLSSVLSKMERTYEGSASRKTDFEIVGADKVNPTSITLKPVPKVKAYTPEPALLWSLEQFRAVYAGELIDERISADIAQDFVRLASKEHDTGYKTFWVNGFAERVDFDDQFLANAAKLVADRKKIEEPTRWHDGMSFGEVVGELNKVDDLDNDNEFVIVPPAGATQIVCKFQPSMRDQIGSFLFKTVKVRGLLHYKESSPFPYLVKISTDGIETYPFNQKNQTLSDLRGIFAGKPKPTIDWGSVTRG